MNASTITHMRGSKARNPWPSTLASSCRMVGELLADDWPHGGACGALFLPSHRSYGIGKCPFHLAGTFVLTALGASFPSKHFFTAYRSLIEAFDQKVYLTRFPLGAEESDKTPHPFLIYQRFQHDCYVERHPGRHITPENGTRGDSSHRPPCRKKNR